MVRLFVTLKTKGVTLVQIESSWTTRYGLFFKENVMLTFMN